MRLVIWSTTTTSAARPRNSRPRSGTPTSLRGASTAGTMSATGSVTGGFAADGDHDRMTVDLVFGCVPAVGGLEAGLQTRRERFAADVRGVLLECVGHAVGCRVAHVDAVRNLEASLLAGVLDQAYGGAGATFGHQLGTERCIQDHQHA